MTPTNTGESRSRPSKSFNRSANASPYRADVADNKYVSNWNNFMCRTPNAASLTRTGFK